MPLESEVFQVADEPVSSAADNHRLVDRRGRPLEDLRLSVIDQCNFRCTYCMPRSEFGPDYEFLAPSKRLSFDQMVRISKAFASVGVKKIRLTGGEPLLRRNLESLVERLAVLKAIDGSCMEVALTTNGTLLAAKAQALRDAGLSRVTVSLDALDDAAFRRIADTATPVARILDGVFRARAVGLNPVKVNAVIERGVNDDQILPLVRFFKGTGVVLRFIEYMDVGGAAAWSSSKVLSAAQMREMVEAVYPLIPRRMASRSSTASNFAHADGSGEIGFIASVSQPFCGDCTRARVSSDGRLYMCLFALEGVDLRPWLDAGTCTDELAQALRARWAMRDDRYSEDRAATLETGRHGRYPTVRMSLVGG